MLTKHWKQQQTDRQTVRQMAAPDGGSPARKQTRPMMSVCFCVSACRVAYYTVKGERKSEKENKFRFILFSVI